MNLAVLSTIYAIVGSLKKKKNQDFDGMWTRDLAIPVRCSDQLSYEAAGV